MKTFDQIENERLAEENRQLKLELAEKQRPKFDVLKFEAALEQEIKTTKREQDSAAAGGLRAHLMVQLATLQSVQLALLKALI